MLALRDDEDASLARVAHAIMNDVIVDIASLDILGHVVGARMKISISTNISVREFYGYIRYISGYFYMNIDISEINKNTLKFMEILSKSAKITLIIKYIHSNYITISF